MQRITSRQNAIVARYRDAARGGADQPLLLDGTHLLREAIAAGTEVLHLLVAADAVDLSEIADVVSIAAARGVAIAVGSAMVMEAASPVRSSGPVVALAVRPTLSKFPDGIVSPLVVIGCDVQDPGNVGAIVRVSEAAGAAGVVLAGMSADPFGWKALRGSMGSALRMPITTTTTVEGAVSEARAHGLPIVATVPRDGIPLFESHLEDAAALLIGGEGAGLPSEVIRNADRRITIPMEHPVESLNAAVATAIVLYEARRQRSAPSAGSGVRRLSARG